MNVIVNQASSLTRRKNHDFQGSSNPEWIRLQRENQHQKEMRMRGIYKKMIGRGSFGSLESIPSSTLALNDEILWEHALRIMKNSTSVARKKEELILLMYVTKDLEFVKYINKKTRNQELQLHEKCCRVLTLETYPSGHVIFQKGELPDKFYLILKGQVSIYMPKDPEAIKEEKNRLKKEDPEFYEQICNPNQKDYESLKQINKIKKILQKTSSEGLRNPRTYNQKLATKKVFRMDDDYDDDSLSSNSSSSVEPVELSSSGSESSSSSSQDSESFLFGNIDNKKEYSQIYFGWFVYKGNSESVLLA
jgi:hypothetical protein